MAAIDEFLDFLDPRSSPLFPKTKKKKKKKTTGSISDQANVFAGGGDGTFIVSQEEIDAAFVAAGGGGGGGGGGGRGRAAPEPTFGVGTFKSTSMAGLQDKLVNYYERIAGAVPNRPSLEWVTNMALGGATAFDIRQKVEATPEFRSRFPNMPAGMDVNVYDQTYTSGNATALRVAGRPMNEREVALMFAGEAEALWDSLTGGDSSRFTNRPTSETGRGQDPVGLQPVSKQRFVPQPQEVPLGARPQSQGAPEANAQIDTGLEEGNNGN